MSESLIFLFLPFGAGSNGVRLYTTVLVTTERTLTGRVQALRGASKYRWPVLSRFQSAGEKGDRAIVALDRAALEMFALLGESADRGDCGIFKRLRVVGVRADCGRTKGDGGSAEPVGDL